MDRRILLANHECFGAAPLESVWRDGDELVFVLANGDAIKTYTEAECCSDSWIEHLSGSQIRGQIVASEDVAELDSHGDGSVESDYDVLSLYGIRLYFENGQSMDLDYRNNSNGYYGGQVYFRKLDKWDHCGCRRVTADF